MDTEVLLPDCEFHKKPFYECIKRIFDLVVSLVAVIVLSPILLVIALAIRLEDRGPILYRAQRVGRGGKPITVYKFRSMRMNADRLEDMLTPEELEEYKKNFKLEHDPRITKVGAFLRKTSLDELPQLFNILKGDMSLVGPRPERPFFVEKFREEIPRYMVKHQVRPGLTGWAQVNGYRGDTSIRKRIEYDLYYIENWTVGLDIKILFMTIFKGFINKNAY